MTVPVLTKADVMSLIPNCEVCGESKSGGQKLFYPIKIDDTLISAKFIRLNPQALARLDEQQREDIKQSLIARCRREVETMTECTSPYLVGAGSVPVTLAEVGDQSILYFTEEFIDGSDLCELKRVGPASIEDVIRLGQHIGEAIQCLANANKIHRDIKPANIMRRGTNGDFVLLDLGLVFDLEDESLTRHAEFVPGTRAYYSPEHMNFEKRREMDFRSDLFCLGVTMYEFSTGHHPFISGAMRTDEIFERILNHVPPIPSSIRADLPPNICRTIQRLMAKKPHLRYRTVQKFLSDINEVEAPR